jgi:RNA-directed DNA polymerase
VDANLCLSGFADRVKRSKLCKIDGWYKVRTYAHFDNPVDYETTLAYVSDPAKVAVHPFKPFLTFTKHERHFSVASGQTVPSPTSKSRSFATPAHLDGNVFSWYAKILSQQYEALIASHGLDSSVLAYRPGATAVVYMAKQALADIASRPACLVIAADIEKFVPSIDHAHLKEDWARVIQQKGLPRDHYAVFKAVTRYASVDRAACMAALKIDAKLGHFPRPLCSGSRFRRLIREAGLIDVNTKAYGLPQGCQLSAILSNIAMLRFDESMLLIASALGGSYRRYCDDILLILGPEASPDDVISQIQAALRRQGPSLKLNSEKTEVVSFARDADGWLRSSCEKGVQYLGFTFDGQRVLIRSRTTSKYVRRMKYAARKAEKAAAAMGTKMFRRSILRRFSPLGNNNFLSRHVRLSQKVMPGDHIRRQFRRQVRLLLKSPPSGPR